MNKWRVTRDDNKKWMVVSPNNVWFYFSSHSIAMAVARLLATQTCPRDVDELWWCNQFIGSLQDVVNTCIREYNINDRHR